jgi:hypothetical protein
MRRSVTACNAGRVRARGVNTNAIGTVSHDAAPPINPYLTASRIRRDTRLSRLCPGITVDAGPLVEGANRLSFKNPGTVGARDRRRVG